MCISVESVQLRITHNNKGLLINIDMPFTNLLEVTQRVMKIFTE